MEAIEEPPPQNTASEAVKTNVITCEESNIEIPVQSDVCHKPNGVADSGSELIQTPDASGIPVEHPSSAIIENVNNTSIVTELEPVTTEVIVETPVIATEEVAKEEPSSENLQEVDINLDNYEEIHTENVEVDGIVEGMHENVRFETEILIETNVIDENSSTKYKIIYEEDSVQTDHTNSILNEIGQNIELSEVLQSSDVTENVENNNCDVAQEVFNKEELLDILEGNDMEESRKVISDNFTADCKRLETQLALQQLSRLKHTKKTRRSRSSPKKSGFPNDDTPLSPKKKRSRKNTKEAEIDNSQTISPAVEPKTESVKKKSKQKEDKLQSNSAETLEQIEETTKKRGNKQKAESKEKEASAQSNNETIPETKPQNIVKALVQDWEDDEPSDGDPVKKTVTESVISAKEGEEIKSQEVEVSESNTGIVDASTEEQQTPNQSKNDSDGQPQRRQSRVIKKKVIFDPDNPDTFTKSKVAAKKENQSEKDQTEQPALKKIRTDLTPRSKSKSPVQAKLQWKKPQPKNMKQNKRLTEIDRLLMDEGAVNMICQLTPEAPQGNKNTKSKAEFIKKIQSSTTPDGKEMKFRERKKELKSEEAEGKKMGKDRLSMKSPSRSEDFEAHSADDSIIYRRHSSSSYSSPCMSPRRMSDVESANQNMNTVGHQPAPELRQIQEESVATSTGSDVFMADSTQSPTTPVINKSNLMSMKEKLNSKLSQALNKRKRETVKAEKPPKTKRVSKSSEKSLVMKDFKYVKLSTDQRLAEICIQQIGTVFNFEVMNELKTVLDTVDSRNDISVTLLTAENGIFCTGLELQPILDQVKGVTYAIELAESARLLLSTLEGHSKLVCAAVEGRCHGLALSLVALSDVTVASEDATFELSASKDMLLQSGAAALCLSGLPQTLLNELIVFERPISAADAVEGGLVSRAVWPAAAREQARRIAADLALQPHQKIMLKKQMLRLKRGLSDTFLTSIQLEKDFLVNYWSSAEGREVVRATVEAARESL